MSTLGEFFAHIQLVETVPCPEAEEWPSVIARIIVPGRIAEITEETYFYFLEVLPPHFILGSVFAFAEGADPVRLFWRKHDKTYCRQLTAEETQTFCRLAKIPIPS